MNEDYLNLLEYYGFILRVEPYYVIRFNSGSYINISYHKMSKCYELIFNIDDDNDNYYTNETLYNSLKNLKNLKMSINYDNKVYYLQLSTEDFEEIKLVLRCIHIEKYRKKVISDILNN